MRDFLSRNFDRWDFLSGDHFDNVPEPPSGEYFIYTGHLNPEELLNYGLLGRDTARLTPLVAVVRNPYSRVVSLFHHFVRHGNFEGDFDTFVDILCGSGDSTDSLRRRVVRMGKPMTSWLMRPSFKNKRILKFEQLHEDVARFAEEFGLAGGLPRIGVWSAKYDATIIGRRSAASLKKLYEKDFLSFGYSNEVPIELRLQ